MQLSNHPHLETHLPSPPPTRPNLSNYCIAYRYPHQKTRTCYLGGPTRPPRPWKAHHCYLSFILPTAEIALDAGRRNYSVGEKTRKKERNPATEKRESDALQFSPHSQDSQYYLFISWVPLISSLLLPSSPFPLFLACWQFDSFDLLWTSDAREYTHTSQRDTVRWSHLPERESDKGKFFCNQACNYPYSPLAIILAFACIHTP